MISPRNVQEPESNAALLARLQEWERVAREADFRLARIAALCSISERQLERVFKRCLNCTPSQWLRQLKCRLARELVAKGYSTKAAAAELRFANGAHFCREFKRVFGASPQTFAPNRAGNSSPSLLSHVGRAVLEAGEPGTAEARRLKDRRSNRRAP